MIGEMTHWIKITREWSFYMKRWRKILREGGFYNVEAEPVSIKTEWICMEFRLYSAVIVMKV